MHQSCVDGIIILVASFNHCNFIIVIGSDVWVVVMSGPFAPLSTRYVECKLIDLVVRFICGKHGETPWLRW